MIRNRRPLARALGLLAAIAAIGALGIGTAAQGATRTILVGRFSNCHLQGSVLFCPVVIYVSGRRHHPVLSVYTFPDCAYSPIYVKGIPIRGTGTFRGASGSFTVDGHLLSNSHIAGTLRYARPGCRSTQQFVVGYKSRL